MQPSVALPAAAPVTLTLCTEPLDEKVIEAYETGSSGPRHPRADGSTAPIAPVIAPCDGFCGTLPAAGPVVSAAGTAFCLSSAPTAFRISSPSGPAEPPACCGRSLCVSLASACGVAGCAGAPFA